MGKLTKGAVALCSFLDSISPVLRNPWEQIGLNMISNIASLHFPATLWARNNLLSESKHHYQIVLAGNPVVDALYMTLKKPVSNTIKSIRKWVEQSGCTGHMLLLTAHRRENQGDRLVGIMEAMGNILKKHPNVCIVYPVHPNPNVRTVIQRVVPAFTYARMRSEATLRALKSAAMVPVISPFVVDDKDKEHFKRMLLIEPVLHDTLAELMSDAYLVLTDSGGIQEESVSLGKPVLILKEETERVEIVHAGAAVLCGAESSKIEFEAHKLLAPAPNAHYQRMRKNAKEKRIYGDGHAGKYIASEIDNRLRLGFTNETVESVVKYGVDSTIFKSEVNEPNCDVVLVVTVWKRKTLDQMLHLFSGGNRVLWSIYGPIDSAWNFDRKVLGSI